MSIGKEFKQSFYDMRNKNNSRVMDTRTLSEQWDAMVSTNTVEAPPVVKVDGFEYPQHILNKIARNKAKATQRRAKCNGNIATVTTFGKSINKI